jgi:murein DD-endopeptidase MepM/ murein hydrolase activator NlpD
MVTSAAAVLVTLLGLFVVPAAPTASWPLDPRPEVVHGFDPPSSTWGAGHRGVDLLGFPGQRVHAAAAGTITFASTLAGRGVVVVNHGALRTTYEPVAASVRRGDVVSEGQVIGTLQLGMSHCFPRVCLHWGLLRGLTYLDPLTLVGAGPIRLLPIDGGVPVGRAQSRPPTVADGARSGARVGEAVGLSQPLGGDVGVDLGGRQ